MQIFQKLFKIWIFFCSDTFPRSLTYYKCLMYVQIFTIQIYRFSSKSIYPILASNHFLSVLYVSVFLVINWKCLVKSDYFEFLTLQHLLIYHWSSLEFDLLESKKLLLFRGQKSSKQSDPTTAHFLSTLPTLEMKFRLYQNVICDSSWPRIQNVKYLEDLKINIYSRMFLCSTL